MFRVAAVVVALVSAACVVAAPVPPPSEKELIAKLWGKTEGVGAFELNGKQLTLRTAGQPARGYIYRKQMNMPRATRTVSGDFEITVKVADATAPNPKNAHEDAWPGTRAGLTVSGGGYCIELHLYQFHQKVGNVIPEELKRVVWLDTWTPIGGAGGTRAQVPADKSTYLRITRKDKTVAAAHSFDGKEWSPSTPRKDLDFPDEVTVGVFFAHSTHQSAAATFDGFTVEKPKELKGPK